ncbi:sigma 54-interacting transcriptional regulator [Pseudodesulfovibrio sp.]|nr:sigma 54-interacting transcriptional regulator [Pseudodesulfovibrio sp.]
MNRSITAFARTISWWILCFAILASASVAQAISSQPQVLVLNSYHRGNLWSDNIMEGIDTVFAETMPDAELFFEYMDTKRHVPEEVFPDLAKLLARKYKQNQFDIIITSDDNALTFLMVYREKLFPKTPVIFCGINKLERYNLGYDSDITGVVEDFDLKSTIDIALKLQPGTKHIASISDRTPSSKDNSFRLKQLMPEYEDQVDFILLDDLTVDELKTALAALPKDTIILHLNFFRDRDGKTFDYKESIELVADNTELPMYVAWDWYLGSGVVGGMMISGIRQGETAAHMAVQYLKGEAIGNMPIVLRSPNQYMFDYEQIKKQQINPGKIPPNSILINVPETFYWKYKQLIWVSVFAFLFLTGVVVLLSFNIARRKRSENELTAIFDNSLVAIFLLKGNRHVVKMNKRVTDVFGYSEDELLGRGIEKLHVSAESYEYFGEQYYQELATQEMLHVEYQYRRKNGEIIWCLASGKALNPPDLSKGSIWVIDDITDRKKNETALNQAREELELRVEERTEALSAANLKLKREIEEHAKAESALRESETTYYQNLESIFGSLPDAIVTVDTDMRILEANKAFEGLADLTRAEVLGKHLEEVLDKHHKPCLEVLVHTLKTRLAVKEHRAQCPENNPRQTVVLSTAPFLNHMGEFAGAVLEIRDISRLVELENRLQERTQFRSIIGRSKPMRRLFTVLDNLADYDTTMLIIGESGTGKELVAEALHNNGASREGPFVRVNCSALSEHLLESELFGHVRGAFTGAYRDKQGRFQAAENGTIFLDEIGDISPSIQLKLLRFLEQREFERVGDSKTIKANVRVIAATNVNLEQKVSMGQFREDLYYRLKVMVLNVPPLRERGNDIKLLVEHFVSVYKTRLTKNITTIDDRAMALLMHHTWPGNVRELKHAVEHACIVCDGPTIRLKHLPPEMGVTPDASGFQPQQNTSQPRLNQESVVAALTQTKWNKTQAAKVLGISRRHLYRKLDEYGLK